MPATPTADPPSRPHSPVAGVAAAQFGKYVRTAKIGDGGMGEVWKAWDTDLRRWVALKFLKSADPEEIARFEREAHTAGRLNHPNIAAIYDIGEHQGRQWIAMQLISGQTLKTFPRVDRRVLVKLIRAAATALQAAHDENIIHRDIKPENLMVVPREKSHHLFVMDFGLARPIAQASDLSVSGILVGTPLYMSPEQARGERVDRRSDIWSLGATLYELLTDRRPFGGKNVLEILKHIQEVEPKAPRKIDSTIDADLETIVLKCLEKKREARYASARELADDLDRWLDAEPIAARPISGVELVIRLVRRNKAITALVLLAAAGSIALLSQHRKSTHDLAVADHRRVESEGRLKELSLHWMQIIERKRDLRALQVSSAAARPALERSVEAVDAFIRHYPDLAQGWYLRAVGNLYLERHDDALADVEQALKRSPDFRLARRLRGMIRAGLAQTLNVGTSRTMDVRQKLQSRLIAQAAEDFRDAPVALDGPRDEQRWGISAVSEDEVIEVVQQAMHRKLVLNDTEGARALLLEKIEERKSEDYAVALGLMLSKGDAETCFGHAVEWAPGYAFAWYLRGVTRAWREDYRGSIDDYTQALAIDPGNVTYLYNRGSSLQSLGDFQAAIADYTEAVRRPVEIKGGELSEVLRLQAGTADAYFNRAALRRPLGDPRGAIEDIARFIEVDPHFPRALLVRGLARYETGDPDGAMNDLEEAIRRDPSMSDAYEGRGTLWERCGDLDRALADYMTAIKLDPKNGIAYFNRGNIRRERREFADAIADYDEALRLRPKLISVYVNRGVTRHRAGDVKGAIEDFSAAIAAQTTDATAYSNRGALYGQLGEFDRALKDLDEALRLRPNHSDALYTRGHIRVRGGDVTGGLADLELLLKIAPADYSERDDVARKVKRLRNP